MKIPVAVFGATLFIAAVGLPMTSIPSRGAAAAAAGARRRGGDPCRARKLRIAPTCPLGSSAACCSSQACGS
jgi:hypothetical protein